MSPPGICGDRHPVVGSLSERRRGREHGSSFRSRRDADRSRRGDYPLHYADIEPPV